MGLGLGNGGPLRLEYASLEDSKFTLSALISTESISHRLGRTPARCVGPALRPETELDEEQELDGEIWKRWEINID